MTVHQCPKCELRFSYKTEVDDHCWHDHPEFRHDLSRRTPPAGAAAAGSAAEPTAQRPSTTRTSARARSASGCSRPGHERTGPVATSSHLRASSESS